MTTMKVAVRYLSVAGLLAFATTAYARPMPTLDLDTLLFSSESVVEGPIIATHTANYEQSADVRVEKTWAGANLTGQTVQIGDLSLYSKGRPWITIARIEKRKVNGKVAGTIVPFKSQPQQRVGPLEKRDRALFFICKPPANSSAYRGVPWWAISSGVYMVRSDGISGFTQWGNPGGYGEVRGTTRALFNAQFAASWARIKELKARLQAPARRQDVAYFQEWKRRRQQSPARRRWIGVDTITEIVDERLKKIAQLGDAARQTP